MTSCGPWSQLQSTASGTHTTAWEPSWGHRRGTTRRSDTSCFSRETRNHHWLFTSKRKVTSIRRSCQWPIQKQTSCFQCFLTSAGRVWVTSVDTYSGVELRGSFNGVWRPYQQDWDSDATTFRQRGWIRKRSFEKLTRAVMKKEVNSAHLEKLLTKERFLVVNLHFLLRFYWSSSSSSPLRGWTAADNRCLHYRHLAAVNCTAAQTYTLMNQLINSGEMWRINTFLSFILHLCQSFVWL